MLCKKNFIYVQEYDKKLYRRFCIGDSCAHIREFFIPLQVAAIE